MEGRFRLWAPDREQRDLRQLVLHRHKLVASYLELIPREESSGGRQKLGAISKQGNRMLRSLLVEAAQIAVRYDPQFRREYLHPCHTKPKGSNESGRSA